MASEKLLRSYFNKVAPRSTTESVGGGEVAVELATAPPKHLESATIRALEKLKVGGALDHEERFATEAIILPDQRPAVRISAGDYKVEHPMWLDFNKDPVKSRIQAILPSVGRIDLPQHPRLPYVGTGFVVGAELLMTNRHVAEVFTSGLGTVLRFDSSFGTGVDFKREDPDEDAVLLNVVDVMMIHPYWDMALLRVTGLGAQHKPLPLSTRSPNEMVGKRVAVIGYPAFDPRNDADVQNQVFGGVYNVKRLQPGIIGVREAVESFGKDVTAITHDSSTLGGNSGSLVFDPASNEVVGLHFAGVYLEKNYAVPTQELSRDPRVLGLKLNFTGAPAGEETEWDSYWSDADRFWEDSAARRPRPDSNGNIQSAATSRPRAKSSEIVVPVEIAIRLGSPDGAPKIAAAATGAVTEGVQPFHDDDLSDRKGYDADFLGAPVPLPTLKDDSEVALLKVGGGHVLKYHHFSLVMNKTRRIAFFTASNIDASEKLRRPEKGKDYTRKGLTGLGPNDREEWFEDERISSRYQLPDVFFNKDRQAFDKGHIVRREDVAWGDSYAEVRSANGDTYHSTNCSPQVKGFNQSSQGEDNWGDLENYVMKQAKTERVTLFAGPVFAKDDPVFVGVDDDGATQVRIPQRFWKLAVARTDGQLQSFAFLLEQDLSDVQFEFAVSEEWQKYLVPVAELESMLNVEFPKVVRDTDQSGTDAGEAVRKGTGAKRRKK